MRIQRIFLKLGKMRKAEKFVIYPNSTDKILKLQSAHRCIVIHVEKLQAVIGKYNKNYPVFFDCTGFAVASGEATLIEIDNDLIQSIIKIIPQKGDQVGSIGYIA